MSDIVEELRYLLYNQNSWVGFEYNLILPLSRENNNMTRENNKNKILILLE